MDPKTYFVLLHLIGLVVGLGSVTTLDLYLLKFLRGDVVTRSDAHLTDLVAKCAAVGLLCLWVSGIGFMTLAWFNNPALFTSPKVQAKIIVVCILTINGAILHFKVLPQVAAAVGRPLFCKVASARSDRILMRVCGAVSAASWWTPFALGTIRELNFAAPIWVFLGAYVIVLGVFLAGFTVVEHYLSTRMGGGGRKREGVSTGIDYTTTAIPATVYAASGLHADRADADEVYRIADEGKSFAGVSDLDRELDQDVERHVRERRVLERRIRALRQRLGGSDEDTGDTAHG